MRFVLVPEDLADIAKLLLADLAEHERIEHGTVSGITAATIERLRACQTHTAYGVDS